jgi:hypothetical protein
MAGEKISTAPGQGGEEYKEKTEDERNFRCGGGIYEQRGWDI